MADLIKQVKAMETERLSMLAMWALCELHRREALRVVAVDDETMQAYHPVEFDPFTSDTYYDSSGLVLSFRDGTPQGDGDGIDDSDTPQRRSKAMANETFWAWLRQQAKRDDRVGDVARDAQRDKETPRRSSSHEVWKSYLHGVGASPEAVESLQEAFDEYHQTLDATATEADYRRGYADGYIVALQDYAGWMLQVDIPNELFDFWQADLTTWARGDASKRIEPPTFGLSGHDLPA